LYGCETWSVAQNEEHELKISENRVLRRIFGIKREDVVGNWRRLHNEKFHNFYASPNNVRVIKSVKMRWSGHV
jgi:hypothetical protein